MKKQKTFTIDENILNEFIRISKEKSINKSLFIENSIKKLIKEYNDNK
jgi:metal-responsive CopG/Arc/MetJ family transcriptional regulator